MKYEFYLKKVIEVENQLTAYLIKESLQIMQNNGFFEYQIYKHPGKLKYTITIFSFKKREL